VASSCTGAFVLAAAGLLQAESGTSPLQWLLQQPVLVAMRLLEASGESVGRVAEPCGFQSPLTLRLHFMRIVGTRPLAYRQTFRGHRAAG